MIDGQPSNVHSAEGAALGFWYQSLYALLTLLGMTTDEAAIGLEQLDDIQLKADGQTLLYQLKHSISQCPPPIGVKSKSLWRTVKAWIDVLPSLTLSETTLHLVTVGGIVAGDPLEVVTDIDADRTSLTAAMTQEALRVREARKAAAKAGKALPYGDRYDGCEAFLALSETDRLNLLRRVVIRAGSPAVSEVESEIAGQLHILPAEQRGLVAERLVAWWDRQIVYSLCEMRDRIVTRVELQSQVSSIIAEIDQGKLVPDFETISQPEDYEPDGMLARQIQLVNGTKSDHERAIREEWKAREQRARWLNSNPAMASTINDYDLVLKEHWSDRHIQMAEECASIDDAGKCASGLKLLRWSHMEAPMAVRPIAQGWGAAYYIRGSYQVLAISLIVGWHPNYDTLLKDAK